jgi:mRNA-degrading endonuclease RelE of RelBE toxin-antitoxin system
LSIKVRLELLSRHFSRLKLNPRNYSERLHGSLKSCYSYHFGHHPEYRILFTIVSDEIIILMIAKRENFYKEAYRRIVY